MKAFEKWHKRFKVKSFNAKIHKMAGWRAALKCIRAKVENYTPEDICYFIDEELEQ